MTDEDLVYWQEVLDGDREPEGGADIEELCHRLILDVRRLREEVSSLRDALECASACMDEGSYHYREIQKALGRGE